MTTQMFELHDLIEKHGFKRVGRETGPNTELKFWFEKKLNYKGFETSGIDIKLSQTSTFYHSIISLKAEVWGRSGTESTSISIKQTGEDKVRALIPTVEYRLMEIWALAALLQVKPEKAI